MARFDCVGSSWKVFTNYCCCNCCFVLANSVQNNNNNQHNGSKTMHSCAERCINRAKQQKKHQSSITWFSFIIPSVVWPSLSRQLHQVIGGEGVGGKIKTAERESAFKPQHSFKRNLNHNNFDYNFKLYPKNKTRKQENKKR